MKLFLKIVAVVLFIIAIFVIPIAMEREDRRHCLQMQSWTSPHTYGAPTTVIPEYCYDKGYVSR